MFTQLITKCFSDGTDFFRTKSTKQNIIFAGRKGFGDMICELSNLCYFHRNSSTHILTDLVNPSTEDFCDLAVEDFTNHRYDVNAPLLNSFKSKSHDNESLCEISNRQFLNCYPDAPYLRLDKEQFISTKIPNRKYVTYQHNAYSGIRRCGYKIDQLKRILDTEYSGFAQVDIGNMHGVSLKEIAYIIENAAYHIGIDSGMTHFSLCIKEKADVHIYVPKNKITGVTYRWLRDNYKVIII